MSTEKTYFTEMAKNWIQESQVHQNYLRGIAKRIANMTDYPQAERLLAAAVEEYIQSQSPGGSGGLMSRCRGHILSSIDYRSIAKDLLKPYFFVAGKWLVRK